MLTAYYDDTGKPGNTPTVSLFGFVADADQWLRFEKDWRIVLNLPQFQLPYFHMKEVRQGKHSKNPAFHKFQDNDSLRRDLFDRLQSVIRCRVEQSFSATVVTSAYNQRPRHGRMGKTGQQSVRELEISVDPWCC